MRNLAPDLLDATFARLLFESSQDGVVITDDRGRALEANAAALALLLARIEPLLTPPDADDAELSAFHEQLRTRGRAMTEVRVTSRCGKLRHVTIEGRAIGSRRLYFLRDVSHLREMQEELHSVRRLESLGHFTATLAHDLNNVLTPIGCLAEMLVRDVGDGTSAGAQAKDVAGLARSGGDLVRRVLAFARGEPTKPQTVDLTAHLEGMRSLADRLLGSGIELALSLEGARSCVHVDPVILEHALLNVLANARDAIFEDGLRGKVTVRTANVLLGYTESEIPGGLTRGPYAMITVTDDGPGMPPSDCDRAVPGLGLGLANAKKFAVESGGSLSVRSEVGEGTTVTMYLPRIDE